MYVFTNGRRRRRRKKEEKHALVLGSFGLRHCTPQARGNLLLLAAYFCDIRIFLFRAPNRKNNLAWLKVGMPCKHCSPSRLLLLTRRPSSTQSASIRGDQVCCSYSHLRAHEPPRRLRPALLRNRRDPHTETLKRFSEMLEAALSKGVALRAKRGPRPCLAVPQGLAPIWKSMLWVRCRLPALQSTPSARVGLGDAVATRPMGPSHRTYHQMKTEDRAMSTTCCHVTQAASL